MKYLNLIMKETTAGGFNQTPHKSQSSAVNTHNSRCLMNSSFCEVDSGHFRGCSLCQNICIRLIASSEFQYKYFFSKVKNIYNKKMKIRSRKTYGETSQILKVHADAWKYFLILFQSRSGTSRSKLAERLPHTV